MRNHLPRVLLDRKTLSHIFQAKFHFSIFHNLAPAQTPLIYEIVSSEIVTVNLCSIFFAVSLHVFFMAHHVSERIFQSAFFRDFYLHFVYLFILLLHIYSTLISLFYLYIFILFLYIYFIPISYFYFYILTHYN